MVSCSRKERSDYAGKAFMKLINPLDHPHSGKAAILIAIALVLGITVHELFFLIALLIAAIACIELQIVQRLVDGITSFTNARLTASRNRHLWRRARRIIHFLQE